MTEATPSDAAFFWNQVLLDALLADDIKPASQREQGGVTRASRAAAIVHAALHDAVNGVDRKISPYLVQDRAPAGASIDAAAAGAAHATLGGLYPSQRTTLDTRLSQYLNSLPAGPGRDSGLQFGREVGNMILMARQHDGRNSPNGGSPSYMEKPTPGEWSRDPIAPPGDQIPPLTPGWGSIRPFTLDYGAQLRPDPYPTLTSSNYTSAFREVRDEGNANAHNPPNDKTEIAKFYSEDDMLGTPIRQYNQHTREILAQRPIIPGTDPAATLHNHARIFALVNLAMADAGIGCWDAKYAYNLWRPVHAIRRAGEDGNQNTSPAPDWRPLGRPRGPVDPNTGQSVPNTSPPFPAYPSGHSTFGTATYAMLRKFTGAGPRPFRFDLSSFELPNVERSYVNLNATSDPAVRSPINENGRSRIFLGVHYNFDDRAGRALGEQLADYIWPNFLRPVN